MVLNSPLFQLYDLIDLMMMGKRTMILISKTYSRTTPESAEEGDYSESGFVYEDVAMTYKELLQELRSCCHVSTSGRWTVYDWFSSEFSCVDLRTGEEEETSIHYSPNNPERNAKYWKLAKLWFSQKRT